MGFSGGNVSQHWTARKTHLFKFHIRKLSVLQMAFLVQNPIHLLRTIKVYPEVIMLVNKLGVFRQDLLDDFLSLSGGLLEGVKAVRVSLLDGIQLGLIDNGFVCKSCHGGSCRQEDSEGRIHGYSRLLQGGRCDGMKD